MSEAMERIEPLWEQVGKLAREGQYQKAISLAQQVCELLKKKVGTQDPRFARGLRGLALLHTVAQDLAAALPQQRQALEIVRAAWGMHHPDFAIWLDELAELYRRIGDPAVALHPCREALAVRCAALGKRHPDFAQNLNRLAALYAELGDHSTALLLLRYALEVRSASRGERHPVFAQSLDHLAELYVKMGDQAAALPLFRRALEMRSTSRGKRRPPDFAQSLDRLAALYAEKGGHAEALPLYRQALEVCRAALGEGHPVFTQSLNRLAELYRKMGDLAGALPLYRQALEDCRAARGERHPDFAQSLNRLAWLYEEMGDYAAALPLCRQALEIRRAALGEAHPHFATSLANLAELYRRMGDLAAALPLCRQALEIERAALGEAHPHFAQDLNNLALLYSEMGDHAAALPLHRQALEVRRAALGEAHPDFAQSLLNLGVEYARMKDYAAALPLFRQALEIRRAALGEAHPDFAFCLNGLAQLYLAMEDYTAALPLFRQALEIRRAALGEAHPNFAQSLNNLAELYQAMGDHATALPLLRQALEVRRAALGEAHPDFGHSLQNLARLYIALGRPSEALPLMEQAAAVDDRMIGQTFSVASERQRTAFLTTVHFEQEKFLSLVWGELASSREAVRAALSLVLRRKAVGAESLATQRDALLGTKYPALGDRFQEWVTLRMQIARKILEGPDLEGVTAHQHLLDQWQSQKERLEAELVQQIPEMNLEQRLRAADAHAIALALPPGAALVEFLRFHVIDFKTDARRKRQPARYLAFVLPALAPEQVQMIDLGEAEPIDSLIADFRSGITSVAENRDDRNLVRLLSHSAPATADTPGVRLRAAVFDKLSPALNGCQRLLLAPDGDLCRLPFEVLPLGDGRRLLDAYRISYVSVGRDVLRFRAGSSRQPGKPLVAADPDFDFGVEVEIARSEQPKAAEPPPRPGFWSRLFGLFWAAPARKSAPTPTLCPPSTPVGPAPSRLSRDLDRSQYHFARLPGTRAEGERIGRRLSVQPLLTGAALEGRLKACRSPRILHLATHGFFLADQQRDLDQFGRSQELLDIGETPGLERLSGPGMENPMLRSGLALAGANTFLRGAALPADAEDGLLTAEDVAGLDLLDTELVVLSACETGLGAIHTGEGVFGLRRAFIVAGAKTLVMSLWKVPDLATAFLMDRFYENLLTRGLDRDLALREAQRSARDVTIGQLKEEWLTPAMIERFAGGAGDAQRHLQQLTAQPDSERPFQHPFFWGAFICQGDPSPLPLMAEVGPFARGQSTGGNV
jgi:tetratricopeptide (TPR) repeat protein